MLLVFTRAAVYCFWLMVVKSMLSCDVSSTTLSRMLIILFSLLSFFSFGSFCLASSGWALTFPSKSTYSSSDSLYSSLLSLIKLLRSICVVVSGVSAISGMGSTGMSGSGGIYSSSGSWS